jgi:hypothetical protein
MSIDATENGSTMVGWIAERYPSHDNREGGVAFNTQMDISERRCGGGDRPRRLGYRAGLSVETHSIRDYLSLGRRLRLHGAADSAETVGALGPARLRGQPARRQCTRGRGQV